MSKTGQSNLNKGGENEYVRNDFMDVQECLQEVEKYSNEAVDDWGIHIFADCYDDPKFR